jgi:hypothetical protein
MKIVLLSKRFEDNGNYGQVFVLELLSFAICYKFNVFGRFGTLCASDTSPIILEYLPFFIWEVGETCLC